MQRNEQQVLSRNNSETYSGTHIHEEMEREREAMMMFTDHLGRQERFDNNDRLREYEEEEEEEEVGEKLLVAVLLYCRVCSSVITST